MRACSCVNPLKNSRHNAWNVGLSWLQRNRIISSDILVCSFWSIVSGEHCICEQCDSPVRKFVENTSDVNECRSRGVSNIFSRARELNFSKSSILKWQLGHSMLHYMLWTTRSMWLRDPGPWRLTGHHGKDGGTVFEVSYGGWPVFAACVCVVCHLKALVHVVMTRGMIRLGVAVINI